MVRNADSAFWALPGGHVEEGETVREALQRELREELGVTLSDHRFEVLGRFTDRAAETGEVFELTLCSGDIVGEPRPAAEIEEHTWFDGQHISGELPPMFIKHARPALERRFGWTGQNAQ